MAGLIDRNINGNDRLSKVSTYQPDRVTMGDGESVESRVARITDKNSPLTRMSRTRANQAGNKRGLLNSTMTLQAGEAAVYDTALPIASQDSSTSANFKLSNQNAKNAAGQFNSGQVNQARGLIEQGRQSMEQIQESGSQTRLNQNNQGDVTSKLQKENYGYDLGRIGAQGVETRKNIGTEGVEQRKNIGVQGIEQRKNIGAQGEQDRLSIQARGEIDKMLQTIQGRQALDQITARGGVEEMLLTQQGQQELDQIDADGNIRKLLQSEQGRQALDQITAQGDQTRESIGAEAEAQAGLQEQSSELRRKEMLDAFGYDEVLQQLRGEQAKELTELETANSLLMQSSQSAAIVFGQHSEAIGNILANPDIPAGQKQGLIDKQIKLLENAMAIQGSISGTNLKDLLDWGSGGDSVGDSGGTDGGAGGSGSTGGTGVGGEDTEGNYPYPDGHKPGTHTGPWTDNEGGGYQPGQPGTLSDGTQYQVPNGFDWGEFIGREGHEDLQRAFDEQGWAASPEQWANEWWAGEAAKVDDPRFRNEFTV